MLVSLQAHYVKLDVQALVMENGGANILAMELMNVNLLMIALDVGEAGGCGIGNQIIKNKLM